MAAVVGVAGVLTAAVAFLGAPVYQRAKTLGITRRQFENIHGTEFKIIPDTVACEDLHYDRISGQLYTSCQDDNEKRSAWFPPLVAFDHTASDSQGTIVVIDPETFQAKTLTYTNFIGPLSPHGIEILSDPTDSSATLIYIVNHLANPEHFDFNPPRSRVKGLERIEIFKHKHGEDEVEHVRSVEHPLVHTANDIAATSANSFYVTNDHHYHEGSLRIIEDVADHHIAPWSNTIHVEFDPAVKVPKEGVKAEVVLTGLHNNNGLGHGRPNHPEINVVDASGGVLCRVTHRAGDRALHVLESIQLDSTLDNPFYYEDLYATAQNNASGYIMPGLGSAHTLASTFGDPNAAIPSLVYHVRSNDAPFDFESSKNTWEKRLIFQDDGKLLRSASGAVLLGIDPAQNAGKKQGWLFVTGFASAALVATKIDL